ncbi:MAG: UvrD-helicase domain-containing protein [Candidatus Spyradosoma sp.]
MSSTAPQLALTRPGLIEASAGTGKTFTIAEIYLALLRGHAFYAPESAEPPPRVAEPPRAREILVVTFTEAATAELSARLRARVRKALDEPAAERVPVSAAERVALRLADAEFDEAAVSTIHGFCMRMLRDFCVECGLPPGLKPVEEDGDAIRRFAARLLRRRRLAGDADFARVSVDDAAELLSLFAKNPETPFDASVAAPWKGAFLEEALAAWRERRVSGDSLSFDEVLLRLRDALRKTPALADKIARRFKVALVDEFQDTDPVQWEIFERVFVRKKKPFFVVGDPKQAIYEFRGGDVFTYRAARERIRAESPGNELALGTNWRSTPEAIAAFNELFGFDARVGDFKGARIGGHLEFRETRPPAEKGAAGAAPAAFLRVGFPGNGDAARKAIRRRLVEDVKALVDGQGVPARSVAVLVGKNSEAETLREALVRAGVPAVTASKTSVFETSEAADVRAVLEAMLAPADEAALRRAATTQFFGKTFYADLTPGAKDADALARLREALFECGKLWERRGVFEAFSRLADAYAFSATLAKLENAAARLTNARHVLELLQSREARENLAPRALFDRVFGPGASFGDAAETALRGGGDEDAVRLVTMHKSKGLEYDFVFLPSLWDRPLKEQNAKRQRKYVREESADGSARLLLRPESGNSRTLAARENAKRFERAEIEASALNESCVAYVALTRARLAAVVYHAQATSYKTLAESYMRRLLVASGLITLENAIAPAAALPHWRALSESEPLPRLPFEPRGEEAPKSRAFDAETARGNALKIDDAWGIYSFSGLVGGHDENARDETDAERFADAEAPAADEVFPAPPHCDLPAGTHFGTFVHAIFEKLDFRSRGNLDALVEANKGAFPEWRDDAATRAKFAGMFDATLRLPFGPAGTRLEEIDVARDALREVEFFFRLRRTEDLYSKLHDVFSRWGGIYARTAETHWARGRSRGPLDAEGFMHGYIDLVARVGDAYFIADWKTNRVMEKGAKFMTRRNLEDEIVESGYALQWAIYAIALRRLLRETRGGNGGARLAGVAYFFVRWNAVHFDDSLDDARLDELETALALEGGVKA